MSVLGASNTVVSYYVRHLKFNLLFVCGIRMPF